MAGLRNIRPPHQNWSGDEDLGSSGGPVACEMSTSGSGDGWGEEEQMANPDAGGSAKAPSSLWGK